MKKRKEISITGLIDATAIGLVVATLLGFMGRFFWVFDLFAHFRVQYFQIGLVLLFIALWKRLHKRAVLLTLLALLSYAFVLPLYFGKSTVPPNKTVRAMLMNINAGNGNTEMVLGAIDQFKPDILLLEEVTAEWASQLAVLHNNYPYNVMQTREDPFGIMLLSRHPIQNERIIDIGSSGLPSIVTDIYLPDGELSFIGTHPVPPISRDYFNRRNLQLMEIPYVAADLELPVLLMGDLNVSPFSYWFKRVTEMTLKNSMKGFGFQPTWPAQLPWPRIPLDHALHSDGIVIQNRIVGGNVGSDHLPVIIDFSIR